MRDVEDPLDHGDAVMQGNISRHQPLGKAVEQQNSEGNQKVIGSHDSMDWHNRAFS
jgi:hypothetical protein